MRPTFIIACAVTGVVGLVASSLLSEAGAAPRSKYKYSGRTGAHLRYQGYPRPYCNFAIAECRDVGPTNSGLPVCGAFLTISAQV